MKNKRKYTARFGIYNIVGKGKAVVGSAQDFSKETFFQRCTRDYPHLLGKDAEYKNVTEDNFKHYPKTNGREEGYYLLGDKKAALSDKVYYLML